MGVLFNCGPIAFLSASCTGPGSESAATPSVDLTSPDITVEATYDKFALPFVLNENQTELCCYSDGKDSIFAVGSRNGKQIGPLYNTEQLYLCSNLEIIAEYEVGSSAYIISAVPYEGDILYVDYTEGDGGQLSWSLKRINGTEETVLDHGSASAFDRVPDLILAGSFPLYLWEQEDCFGINQISGDTIHSIVEESSYTLPTVEIKSNGTYYCYMAAGPDDDNATMFIGNEEGIVWSHPLADKITSFAITDEYAVCGLGGQYFSVDAVNLSTGESKSFQVDKALWRMSGSGEACVCVDDQFIPYYVDISQETIRELPRPEEKSYQAWPTIFYPVDFNHYYARFSTDDAHMYYNFYLYTNQ